jgi:Nif-specific regulatory protein
MSERATTPTLIAVGGVSSGEVFPLEGATVSFGRDPGNAICFPDPALSRRHCEFARVGTEWRVRDLASANGTFVNGLQVTDHALIEGDRVSVGESILLFVCAANSSRERAEVIDDVPFARTTRLEIDKAAYLLATPGSNEPPAARALRVLLKISAIVNSIPSESELHREVLHLLVDAVPAEEGAIVLVGPDAALTPAATFTRAVDRPVRISHVAVKSALAERAGLLSSGSDCQGEGGSFLTAPITVRSHALGAICLSTRGAATLNDDHLELVTAVARIVAIALENVRHVSSLERETDRLQADLQLAHNMVGGSPSIQRVYDRIARIARSDSTVLIVGETGTGKELAARAIHLNGVRARRPFVAINCATLGEQLLESELFGHERGAFTGAVAAKKGKLELADGGTLFLDEVAELAPALQSKLLRVLQEREFERVGGTRPIRVDIRLLSATNRALPAEIAAGRFREDLYFRLNVVSIEMPPLRERPGDIPLLARHFLARCGRKGARRIVGISAGAIAALTAYDWPGNVRELENAVERAAVLGSTDEIVLEDLPETIIDASISRAGEQAAGIHGAVLDTKKRAIVEAFRRAGGSYTQAARFLGVHPNYLHRLIRSLGIKPQLEAQSQP